MLRFALGCHGAIDRRIILFLDYLSCRKTAKTQRWTYLFASWRRSDFSNGLVIRSCSGVQHYFGLHAYDLMELQPHQNTENVANRAASASKIVPSYAREFVTRQAAMSGH
jgi:hypothetical protein